MFQHHNETLLIAYSVKWKSQPSTSHRLHKISTEYSSIKKTSVAGIKRLITLFPKRMWLHRSAEKTGIIHQTVGIYQGNDWMLRSETEWAKVSVQSEPKSNGRTNWSYENSTNRYIEEASTRTMSNNRVEKCCLLFRNAKAIATA